MPKLTYFLHNNNIFNITEKSKKESKGWLSKDREEARNNLKNASNRYKKSNHLST